MNYYQLEKEDVLKQLDVDQSGLSSAEVKARQERDGFNELEEEEKRSTLGLFLDSFKDAMVIILLVTVS